MHSRRTPNAPRLALLSFAALLIASSNMAAAQSPSATGLAPPKLASAPAVLIDGIHANDLTTVALDPGVHEYHATTGCRRSFEYLRARGVRCDRVTDGRLDAQRLANYRMLFVNLVSAERPSFLVSEIAAIRSFVQQGGSLLVIVEHSNAYFHSYRLEPLLAELDLQTPICTVCEQPPRTVGQGHAWITVTQFKPHPITTDLKCLHMQTGGSVDPRFAVAWTSPQAWADAWSAPPFGEAGSLGFYGNFQRDPGEPGGPLGVVLARQFGKGRIVIFGDQNMVGSACINYADNYRLWLNTFAWLLDEPALRNALPYRQWRAPRIVCYERPEDPAFAANDPEGCYDVWAMLNRHWWTFANDRLDEPSDLLIFAFNEIDLPPEAVSAVAAHLRQGKNVLILNADSLALQTEASVVGRVLKAMAPQQPARQTRPGKLVLQFPGAGAIHVLGPDVVLDNGKLALPTLVPNEAQQARFDALLDAVRETLGKR